MRIGELAVTAGYIDSMQLEIALSEQRVHNTKNQDSRRLGSVLVELKMISEDRLGELVKKQKEQPSFSHRDKTTQNKNQLGFFDLIQPAVGAVLLVTFITALVTSGSIEFASMILGLGGALWATVNMVGEARPDSRLGLYYASPILMGLALCSVGILLGTNTLLYLKESGFENSLVQAQRSRPGVQIAFVLIISVILLIVSVSSYVRRHKEIHWKSQISAHAMIMRAATDDAGGKDIAGVLDAAANGLSHVRYGTLVPRWLPILPAKRLVSIVYFEKSESEFIPLARGYGSAVSGDLKASLEQLYEEYRPPDLNYDHYIKRIKESSESAGFNEPREWRQFFQQQCYSLSEQGNAICSLTGFCYHYNVAKCTRSLGECLAFDRAFLDKASEETRLETGVAHLKGSSVFAHPVYTATGCGNRNRVCGVLMVFAGSHERFRDCDASAVSLAACAIGRCRDAARLNK